MSLSALGRLVETSDLLMAQCTSKVSLMETCPVICMDAHEKARGPRIAEVICLFTCNIPTLQSHTSSNQSGESTWLSQGTSVYVTNQLLSNPEILVRFRIFPQWQGD